MCAVTSKMRIAALVILFYAAVALQPVAPVPASAASVVAATKFLKAQRASKAKGKRRTRKRRARRIVYAKPPIVYVQPDRVEVIAWEEYWQRVEVARSLSWVKWF